jgi:hypothetical protein
MVTLVAAHSTRRVNQKKGKHPEIREEEREIQMKIIITIMVKIEDEKIEEMMIALYTIMER